MKSDILGSGSGGQNLQALWGQQSEPRHHLRLITPANWRTPSPTQRECRVGVGAGPLHPLVDPLGIPDTMGIPATLPAVSSDRCPPPSPSLDTEWLLCSSTAFEAPLDNSSQPALPSHDSPHASLAVLLPSLDRPHARDQLQHGARARFLETQSSGSAARPVPLPSAANSALPEAISGCCSTQPVQRIPNAARATSICSSSSGWADSRTGTEASWCRWALLHPAQPSHQQGDHHQDVRQAR